MEKRSNGWGDRWKERIIKDLLGHLKSHKLWDDSCSFPDLLNKDRNTLCGNIMTYFSDSSPLLVAFPIALLIPSPELFPS